jgi:glycosyltransferase involved in cell wall biosynthesis
MKVVHLCNHMDGGGAFQGMWNLHRGLIASGVESRILARDQDRQVPFGTNWDPDPWGKEYLRHISLRKIWSNRTRISNTHFSLDYLGVDVCTHPWVQEADILHLHWVADYLSSHSIARLAELKKPILWTLHDIRPLTGGCHYPAGCKKYTTGCNQCPQLIRNRPPITLHAWKALREAIRVVDVEWIGPSRWICNMAKMARVARPEKIHHIPYGIDRCARPLRPQAEARKLLGLPLDQLLILIASSDLREKRKGADLAKNILAKVRRSKKQSINVSVVVVGQHSESFACQGWQVHSLGKLDRDRMALVYQASDILLFPSLEDNLPLVLLEAIAHGLLPVASSVGGVSDVLPEKIFSDLLFPPRRPEEGAKKLLRVLGSRTLRVKLRKTILHRARKLGSWSQQAIAHKALYSRAIKTNKSFVAKPVAAVHREGGSVSFPLFSFWAQLGRHAKRIFQIG